MESFVTALQEQKEGEFISPLESLSFPYSNQCCDEQGLGEDFRRVLTSLREQIVLGKLRSLKYLSLGFLKSIEMAEDFGLRVVAHAFPNLQVLALDRDLSSDFNYVSNIGLPDNVFGAHNCINFNRDYLLTDWKEKSPQLIGLRGKFSGVKLLVEGLWKTNVLSSLKVLIVSFGVLDKGAVDALAINCPALRLLEIHYLNLCCWPDTWNALLKKLFVLILHMRMRRMSELWSLSLGCFSEGCNLRVLTVHGEYCSEFLLWLEERLNIIDVRLTKLFLLNVVFCSHNKDNDYFISEDDERRRDNLKYHFNQKSVDLTFTYHGFCRGLVPLL